eukprot:CAMPEP_0170508328 /NCGR_PEP_ID=MMETSP0208-20121228/62003_1 /TAXON_ID=197538 /ORGANISM="Strombidium inclinatum, Strain S3" /LENGTH=118 /DNA_ID=CAMNT_0010791157 /DNA_START=3066 /DNA_END=3422 /DNA_ORIENTATION=-
MALKFRLGTKFGFFGPLFDPIGVESLDYPFIIFGLETSFLGVLDSGSFVIRMFIPLELSSTMLFKAPFAGRATDFLLARSLDPRGGELGFFYGGDSGFLGRDTGSDGCSSFASSLIAI